MKIRSLLLGSLAVAGLSTAGYAADLGVVTSLDVCDELGLSGLTISSDENCLVITGGVSFEYDWGSYDPGATVATFISGTGTASIIDDDGALDSSADVDAWLKFVGTADTDFGPASATIKLISEDNDGTSDWTVGIDEAWVGVGDTTMLMAGYKSSIFNDGDDVPLNYLGLFYSDYVDDGVGAYTSSVTTGGDVLQVVSNLGNGISVGGGLENLGAGGGDLSMVGVLSYAGDGLTAHVSVAADTAAAWNLHAGFSGTWDPITVVAAVAADDSGYWDALGSAALTFDMFKIAFSGEATSNGEYGAGASVGATVTDGVSLNVGGRYFSNGTDAVWQAEAGLSAAVTETLTLTAAVGAIDSDFPGAPAGTVYYGKGGIAWAPGDSFKAGASIEVNSLGAYKIATTASKDIK